MLHTDFETFSEVDLRASGLFRYVEHPSFEILMMCWAVEEGPVWTWLPSEPSPALWGAIMALDLPLDLIVTGPAMPPTFRAAMETKIQIAAHNAQFESTVYEEDLHKRKGWPAISPRQWYCTAAHAAALKLPRALDKAGAAIGASIQKDKEGSRLIKMFCVPRKPTKKNPAVRIMPNDAPADFAKFISYCQFDVRSERALLHKFPPMLPREVQVWQYDQLINRRGLPIDTHLVKRTLGVVQELERDIAAQTRALTITPDNPQGIAPTQVAKLLEFIQDAGGDTLFSLQRKEIEEQMGLKQFPEKVDQILELRMEAARVSTKKLISMLNVCSADSRARGTLLYHGAGPGRWTGRLIQPHNFVRGTYHQKQRDLVVWLLERFGVEELRLLFTRPMEAISNVMRAFIAAHEGRVLYVADYSSIEARVLMWVAGQDDIVEMYARNVDLYIWMAAKIWGVPEDSIDKDTPGGYEKRRTGKHVILGCGYGMGIPKFIITCKEVGGFVIEESLAQVGVTTYRKVAYKVPLFWRAIENAAVNTVRTGAPHSCGRGGCIQFYMDGDFLFMKLPSGRSISYPYPKLYPTAYGRDGLTYMTENSYTRQWERENTYGGKLTENAIMGIARDLMVNGMINVEKKGYEVVGTVHDEIISERDAGTGNVHEYEQECCTLPTWAIGCPIAAEGFSAKRWRKQ